MQVSLLAQLSDKQPAVDESNGNGRKPKKKKKKHRERELM